MAQKVVPSDAPAPKRLKLREPSASDAAEFVAAAQASRALHRLWVKAPATEAEFLAFVEKMQNPGNRALLLIANFGEQQRIAGVFNITNMVLGNFCSAFLGYYAFAHAAGTGAMTWGLNAVCARAFRDYGLHRLEANIQVGNHRSVALAQRCGFQLEGYSPRYLKIGGRWRDHERWARVKP